MFAGDRKGEAPMEYVAARIWDSLDSLRRLSEASLPPPAKTRVNFRLVIENVVMTQSSAVGPGPSPSRCAPGQGLGKRQSPATFSISFFS
jgi:hypothetical protein